jgi:hypothetical protein
MSLVLAPFYAVGAAPATSGRTASTAAAAGQQLRAPVAVFWSGDPLRRALTQLGAGQGVTVLLDRRVDPEQGVELRVAGAPLEEVLRRVAEAKGLGLAVLGPVVYLGPPHAAALVRPLSQLRSAEAKRLPAQASNALLRLDRLRWDDFATPRALLGRLAQSGGIAVSGLDRVPHDLWAAADLPPLSLVDRLTLIAIQFDLTFEIAPDGASVVLVPIPDDLEAVPPGKAAAKTTTPRRTMPAHRTAPGRRSVGAAEVRFTQRPTRGPVGVLLVQLAEKLGLELRIDRDAIEAAGISLDQTVSFGVENATADELLEALLAPAGLAFRRTGKVLQVFPAR